MAGRTLVLFEFTGHGNIVDTSLPNGTTISSLSTKINIQTHTRFKRTLIYYGLDNTLQIFKEIPFLSLLIITQTKINVDSNDSGDILV